MGGIPFGELEKGFLRGMRADGSFPASQLRIHATDGRPCYETNTFSAIRVLYVSIGRRGCASKCASREAPGSFPAKAVFADAASLDAPVPEFLGCFRPGGGRKRHFLQYDRLYGGFAPYADAGLGGDRGGLEYAASRGQRTAGPPDLEPCPNAHWVRFRGESHGERDIFRSGHGR